MPQQTPKKVKKKKEDDEIEEWKKSRQLLKPKDQVDLTEAQLRETIENVLTISNTQQPDSLVQFNFASGGFEPIPINPNIVVVLEMTGTLMHKRSQEAKEQLIAQGADPASLEGDSDEEEAQDDEEDDSAAQPEEPEFQPEMQGLDQLSVPSQESLEGEGEGEGEEEEEGEGEEVKGEEVEGEGAEGEGDEGQKDEDEKEEGETITATGPKKVVNMFNFCERAALTYNLPTRANESQTVPPPHGTFSANVKQFIIFDEYQKDYAEQMAIKQRELELKEKDKVPITKNKPAPKKKIGREKLSEQTQAKVYDCWKVMERMINMNTFDDIAKDFRFWDDPSDEFREAEGTLLPLWKYSLDKTKKNTVTEISWNPWYYDLFAVCFGFLDFMEPVAEGACCLFTLKNPAYPDYICMTDSGVMCVDIHPMYPSMTLIGLYDGNVQIFNVQAMCKTPVYRSNTVSGKHSDIVWDVKWAPNLPDGEMNFFSVSADGKVNNWILMQDQLRITTVIVLYPELDPVVGPDGTPHRLRGCASCVTFHPKNNSIFMIGTEEGLMYKCSTGYANAYLLTYNAHHLPIHRIDFNKYNTDIFVSCSADWRVKVWEDNRLEALYVFDLGTSVGDVRWAPFSSTVLAACTSNGKVSVFDLNINKYKPICVQAVVSKKKNRLTRMTFNPKEPIIICGDEKGCVTSLKLSPNLRIQCKAPKKQPDLDQWTMQCDKLDKLLALVREPVTLKTPPDPNA